MATTLIPPTPAPAPRPAPAADALRFVAIRADLLPDEVRSARQTVALRRRVLLALALVAVLLAAGYGFSWWQTSSARSDLAAAQRRGDGLQSQQSEFKDLIRTQAQVQAIQAQLRQLMTGDLQWQGLLGTLRAKAPAGVAITTISATVNTGAVGGSAAPAVTLNKTGEPSVGQLTISGTAPDKRTTAAYADALGTVPGLTAPLITNVTSSTNSVTFSVSLVITSTALGGRYAAPTTRGR